MRLDLAIVGVQKASTTALARYLDQHPRLCFPPAKETHFFWRQIRDGKPVDRREDQLERHYEACAQNSLLCDATPVYSYWPFSLELLKQHSPNIKCVMVLRNPVLRAFSHWSMEVRRKREDLSFSEAIRTGRRRVMRAPGGVHKTYSYVERGFYADQVRRLKTLFPPDQVMLMRSDEVHGSSQTLHMLLEYASVGQIEFTPISEHLSPGGLEGHRDWYDDFAYLHSLYQDDLNELRKLVPFDVSDWIDEVPSESDFRS